MQKRYILYLLIILFLSGVSYRIWEVCVKDSEKYNYAYNALTNRLFSGASAPRGRILDVKGRVLVDNIGVNTLMYRINGSSTKEIVNSALKIAHIISLDNYLNDFKLKKFYLILHNNGNDLISSDEMYLYKQHKLNSSDILALKMSRITTDMIDSMSEDEKKASYIYDKMVTGYAYQNKIIKSHLTDREVALIREANLNGVSVNLVWERVYPHGNTLKTIFGNVSKNSLPIELKDYYLNKGLSLDASVGTSGLEYQYDEYLRGTDAVYKINHDGSIIIDRDEVQGNDLYLSIDIDIQREVENILKEEMIKAKKAKNTEYYNHSYVLIGHPLTGEIVAMTGLFINGDNFFDVTTNVINSSYTVGSIVKGASMSVGYDNDLIVKGKIINDSCVKLLNVPRKCSIRYLGYIDDIKAMAWSSNYYQFMIAVNLTNPKYRWNSKLNASIEHFDIYRNMFKSYGLGSITGIDLPNEKLGITGKTISDDLLLNFTIGQYDTYTPIQILQYINTLANSGERISPSLMNKIVDRDGKIIIQNTKNVLNGRKLSKENMERVQEGLKRVMTSGTGTGYKGANVTSAGKTGTSETFVDSDGDGVMDTKTISTAFIMYAPFDNPEYSIALITPNISHTKGTSSYRYSLNSRVNRKIMKYLFENK